MASDPVATLRPVGLSDVAIAFPLGASDLAIAGISAGAALLRALVGGLVTFLVEQDRQQHERAIEEQRHENEQASREQQDLAVARGLARVLFNDLSNAKTRLEVEREMDRWLEPEVWSPRLGADDRRDLVRYLRTDEFLAVVLAESQLERLDDLRRHVPDRTRARTPSAVDV